MSTPPHVTCLIITEKHNSHTVRTLPDGFQVVLHCGPQGAVLLGHLELLQLPHQGSSAAARAACALQHTRSGSGVPRRVRARARRMQVAGASTHLRR